MRTGILMVTFAAIASAQPTNSLCSYLTNTVTFGGSQCSVPYITVTFPIWMTVTEYNTYPIINGPMQSAGSQQLNTSGTGLCGISTDVYPLVQVFTSTNGSGADFNQYTQTWQALISSLQNIPLTPVYWWLTAVPTQIISYPAYGCTGCLYPSGGACGICGQYQCDGSCLDSCSQQASGCANDSNCSSGNVCDDGTCVADNDNNDSGDGDGNGDGGCDPYLNSFGSWICDGTLCQNGCTTDGCSCINTDPIIIDLTGNGYRLTDTTHGVKFDFAGNRNSPLTSWTAANWNGGFLALDLNGNGKIDSGKELFGNLTAQPAPAPGKIANGFLALAVYDTNHDGWINAEDPIFPKLLIWIDKNHNGISDPGELITLQQAGITAISVDYKQSQFTDAYGNAFRYTAPIKATNPALQSIYDVLLQQAVPNKASMQLLTKQ